MYLNYGTKYQHVEKLSIYLEPILLLVHVNQCQSNFWNIYSLSIKCGSSFPVPGILRLGFHSNTL